MSDLDWSPGRVNEMALWAGQVRLRWFEHSQVTADFIFQCDRLMSEAELRRRDGFGSEQRRLEFTLGRALLREALSEASDIAPRDWVIEEGEHGKPRVSSPTSLPTVDFSLTHARGLVAVAIARGSDVGVDAEDRSRRADFSALAESTFSPEEQKDIFALPEAQRSRRFFEYWTLKESWIKATGRGLSVELASVAFDLENRERILFRNDPKAWRFALIEPTAQHQLAVAARVAR